MGDVVVTAVSEDGALRAHVARTSETVREALKRHQPGPLAALALARGLSAAAVYPATQKTFERAGLQFSGAGPLSTLYVERRAPGNLRGFVSKPAAVVLSEHGLDSRRGGLGLLPEGFLNVVTQRPDGAFAQSQVTLTTGEVDEDLEAFFEQSDQVPTRVRAVTHMPELTTDLEGTFERAITGAVFAQVLPEVGTREDLPAPMLLEAPFVPEEDLVTEMLQRTFGLRPYRVLDEKPLQFACTCSQDRVTNSIRMLDDDELKSIIEEDGGAQVTCEFCRTEYAFSESDLEGILAERARVN